MLGIEESLVLRQVDEERARDVRVPHPEAKHGLRWLFTRGEAGHEQKEGRDERPGSRTVHPHGGPA